LYKFTPVGFAIEAFIALAVWRDQATRVCGWHILEATLALFANDLTLTVAIAAFAVFALGWWWHTALAIAQLLTIGASTGGFRHRHHALHRATTRIAHQLAGFAVALGGRYFVAAGTRYCKAIAEAPRVLIV
jgi:hypothetical protein